MSKEEMTRQTGPGPRRNSFTDGQEITSRGFVAPASLPERIDHERERIVVVRLTSYELRLMRAGVVGKVKFFQGDRDTYDVVLTTEPRPEGASPSSGVSGGDTE